MDTYTHTSTRTQVKQEKVNLENLLEQEQEYIVNKLQKQLSTVLDEKRALESRLRENTEAILGTIHQHLQCWRRDNAATELPLPLPTPRVEAGVRGTVSDLESDGGEAAVQRTHLLVTHLTNQIDSLGQQQETYRADCTAHQTRNAELRTELQRLQIDNAALAHRVAREREKARDYSSSYCTYCVLAMYLLRTYYVLTTRKARDSERENARLETELELETERAFNLGSASGSHSRCSSYPPSPALSSTSGLNLAMISPRQMSLSQPYSPTRSSRDLDAATVYAAASALPSAPAPASSATFACSGPVSRADSAGRAASTASAVSPGRGGPRAPSPQSAGMPKQTDLCYVQPADDARGGRPMPPSYREP